MRPPSSIPFVLWLGIVAAGVPAAGCGGSSSMPAVQVAPSPSPSPGPAVIASGGRLVASGSKGVTFTFAFGADVPAGEIAVVSAMPSPAPCVPPSPMCSLDMPPLDGFALTVGPQPLSVSALTSVVLAGVPGPFEVSMQVEDTNDFTAFTIFGILLPTGGPLRIGDPVSLRPVLTLAPNHSYTFALFSTMIASP